MTKAGPSDLWDTHGAAILARCEPNKARDACQIDLYSIAE